MNSLWTRWLSTQPEVLDVEAAQLAESPVWNPFAQTLCWVDIEGGVLHQMSAIGVQATQLTAPLSAVALTRDGLLLVMGRGVYSVEADGSQPRLLWTITGDDEVKLNDCRVDGRGRLWVGSVATNPQRATGKLYRLAPHREDGVEAVVMAEGIGLSNGIDFSPDDQVMYLADSRAGVVEAFDLDTDTGALSGRRTFAQVDDGSPDGLTVDNQGGVWLAVWGGWEIRRYRPDGSLDKTVRLPVAQVTSCAFAGPTLDVLVASTARENLSAAELRTQPDAGRLFAWRPGVTGRPQRRCALRAPVLCAPSPNIVGADHDAG